MMFVKVVFWSYKELVGILFVGILIVYIFRILGYEI